MAPRYRHASDDTAHAISRFFAVRGLVRTTLARGERRDPSAWLHIETLKFVADRKGARITDLAEYLSITVPSASVLLSRLTKDGLVRRSRDARDRRTVRIALTPKGKRTLAAALKRGAAALGELFAFLSPSELREFTRALERILEAAS